MFMTMGIFALADFLRQGGYSSKILHLGVEKLLNHRFSIITYVKSREIPVLGISLQWYEQSGNCISLVNKIKSASPGVKIVLGGFTASFFAGEIMERYENIDFLILFLRILKA